MKRLEEYCDRRGLVLKARLGFGVHGSVYSAENQSNGTRAAVKSFLHESPYVRERDVYFHLLEEDVKRVRGMAVPELVGCDDERWIIEMTIVSRPFVLDFGGAYLDRPPDYSEEVWEEWRTQKKEQFESRWPEVQAVIRAFERFGVYIADVNPGNVSFGD